MDGIASDGEVSSFCDGSVRDDEHRHGIIIIIIVGFVLQNRMNGWYSIGTVWCSIVR